MEFGIIFTVDVANSPDAPKLTSYYAAPRIMRKLTMTESDDRYDDFGCDFTTKHRKYAGVLSKDDFKQFVDETGLFAQDIETGGALGMPGNSPWYGWSPAISFDNDDRHAIINAYVTPYPNTKAPDTDEKMDRAWERVRAAVIRQFS